MIGGRDVIFGSTVRADVISAQAGTDGTLGAWRSLAPLPDARSNLVAVVAGKFLYVLGGYHSQATDTVFAAQVRF